MQSMYSVAKLCPLLAEMKAGWMYTMVNSAAIIARLPTLEKQVPDFSVVQIKNCESTSK